MQVVPGRHVLDEAGGDLLRHVLRERARRLLDGLLPTGEIIELGGILRGFRSGKDIPVVGVHGASGDRRRAGSPAGAEVGHLSARDRHRLSEQDHLGAGERLQLARLRGGDLRRNAAHLDGLLRRDLGIDELCEAAVLQRVEDRRLRDAEIGGDERALAAHPHRPRRHHADVLLGDQHHGARHALAGHQQAHRLEVLVQLRGADEGTDGDLDDGAIHGFLDDLVTTHEALRMRDEPIHTDLEVLHLLRGRDARARRHCHRAAEGVVGRFLARRRTIAVEDGRFALRHLYDRISLHLRSRDRASRRRQRRHSSRDADGACQLRRQLVERHFDVERDSAVGVVVRLDRLDPLERPVYPGHQRRVILEHARDSPAGLHFQALQRLERIAIGVELRRPLRTEPRHCNRGRVQVGGALAVSEEHAAVPVDFPFGLGERRGRGEHGNESESAEHGNPPGQACEYPKEIRRQPDLGQRAALRFRSTSASTVWPIRWVRMSISPPPSKSSA